MKTNIIHALFIILAFALSLVCNESASVEILHVEIPRKVAKRLHIVKDKIDKKMLSAMPAFSQLMKEADNNNNLIDQHIIQEALRELDDACMIAEKKIPRKQNRSSCMWEN